MLRRRHSKTASNNLSAALLGENRKHRDRSQIIASVLRACKSGAFKTHVMYKATLSVDQTNEILPYLEQRGLLERKSYQEGKGKKSAHKTVYFTTAKGFEFMTLQEK